MNQKLIKTIPAARSRARLEFTYENSGGEEWTVFYELVLPLGEVDCRGTFDRKAAKRPKSHRLVWLSKENAMRIPLGRTKCTTSNKDYPFYPGGELSTPFRDGAHAGWDAEKLGLKIYAHTSRGIYELTPTK